MKRHIADTHGALAHLKAAFTPRCNLCDFGREIELPDTTLLKEHLAAEHGYLACEFCSALVPPTEPNHRCYQLVLDRTLGAPEHECVKCPGERFRTRDPNILVLHVEREHGRNIDRHQCANCGIVFKGPDGLQTHLETRHRPKAAEALFRCAACGQTCENAKLLKIHAQAHFFGDYEERYISQETKDEVRMLEQRSEKATLLRCAHCRFVTKEQKLLAEHERSCAFAGFEGQRSARTEGGDFRCPFCLVEVEERKKAAFVTHLKVMHRMTSTEIYANFRISE